MNAETKGASPAATPHADAEAELQALREALAESEALSAGLAHEVRSPVGAIAIFSSLLANEAASTLAPEGRALVERLSDCSQRTVRLLDRLAVYSRAARQELAPVPLDLRRAVEAAFLEQAVNAGDGVRPVLVLGELPGIVADQGLLHALLAELLSNAVKCSAGRPEPRIEVQGSAAGDEVRFSVSDNGVGFDPARAERLFTPFGRVHSQAELPGTGLGLALVRRIARRHGGRAWGESAPEAGATFHVALPGGRPPGDAQSDSAARLAE